ncbi:hypothetical protein R5R35_012144 [Gryllus longicercus]|uniref:Uncharacterized protein n=1 Tax=Gryllus longicercus TaxID=2509291 RepID=A0AAN9WEV0_9ORTH
MRVGARFLLPALVLLASLVEAQDGGFQLPVQLIGFPVIIMAVRISNFMKKLAYAVNPRTYARRARRALEGKSGVAALGGAAEAGAGAAPDPATVEKLLLNEFGARVCVYERVCAQYAQRALAAHGHNQLLDWDTVFSRYKSAPPGEKQNYLLSVFLGDMVRSPSLCLGLAKRGRSCTAMEAAERSINHLPREHQSTPSTSTSRSVSTSVSSSSTSTRRRTKPHTRVPAPAHHVPAHHTPAHHAPAHHAPAHHAPVASTSRPPHHAEEHHPERRRQPAHPAAHHAPAHHPPAHRQPEHPGPEHHSEVHRQADHPAQTARRPRPARRRPTTHAQD